MTCGDRACAAAIAIACCLALVGAPAAQAQSAEAEVLFRDGRKLIKAGKLAEGCEKLEASERLESSVGALLNLGDCREKLGQLASAWAAFRKAESQAKHAVSDDKRRAEAHRRAAAIEPRLAYLVLQIDRPAAGLPPGLIVRRGGVPVDAELWNTPVPIDPGTYEIAAAAPGLLPWSTQVTVEARARRIVVVPALEPAPPPPPVEAVPLVAIKPTTVRTAQAPRRASTWTTSRRVSAGLAAIGAGALGTGAYFGWRTRSLAERADRRCPDIMCGDAEALRLNANAREAATTANVLYAAGGAAAVAAAVLWLSGAPGDTRIKPGVAGGAGHSRGGGV